MRTLRTLAVLAFPVALAACGHEPMPVAPFTPEPTAAVPGPERNAIARAVGLPHRSAQNRARDVYRHPVETLSFFGLRANMTVLELWPGNGWYTEILAPLLADGGKLIVTSLDPDGPQDKMGNRLAREFATRVQQEPWFFGKVQVSRIDPPAQMTFAPEGSVDLALIFRTTHDWVRDGYPEKAYAAIFRAVKPGGTLGVVAHRAAPGASVDPKVVGKSGYLPEDYVIKLAEGAGFKLADRSEVNANPRDVRDYPEGVWTLPPSLRLKDQDREKYVAIGESDRMTLKFVKPAK
jgi:predicted methyltransferase